MIGVDLVYLRNWGCIRLAFAQHFSRCTGLVRRRFAAVRFVSIDTIRVKCFGWTMIIQGSAC